MKGFLDRFLPASERAAALWFVAVGSFLSWLDFELYSAIQDQIASVSEKTPIPAAGQVAIFGLATFALYALVVAGLIRFAKAPKTLALHLALFALANLAFVLFDAVLALTVDTVINSYTAASGIMMLEEFEPFVFFSEAIDSVGVALGAMAGAWIALTVSVNRIRNVGISAEELALHGNEPPARVGLDLTFMGWEGRPTTGTARVAVALVAITLIPWLANTLIWRLQALVYTVAPPAEGSLDTIGLAGAVLVSAAWLASAYLITRRFEVRSAWLMSLHTLVSVVIYLVGVIAAGAAGSAVSEVGLLAMVAASLLGAHLAINAVPATLHPTQK